MPKSPKMSQSVLDEILKMYDSGKYSKKEISEQCDYSYSTVVNNIERFRGEKGKITTEEVQKLIKEGYNRYELAKKFGCTYSTILFHASQRKSREMLSSRTIEQIKAFLNSGNYTRKEVADILQIPIKDVYKYGKGIKVNHRIPPSHIKEIDELYKSGHTISSLCERYGYSQPTIKKYISEVRSSRNAPSQETIDLIRKLIKPDFGYTTEEIMQRCNVSRYIVLKYTTDLRIPRKKVTPKQSKKIQQLYKTGKYSQRELAVHLDLAVSTVSRHIKGGNAKETKGTQKNYLPEKKVRRIPKMMFV